MPRLNGSKFVIAPVSVFFMEIYLTLQCHWTINHCRLPMFWCTIVCSFQRANSTMLNMSQYSQFKTVRKCPQLWFGSFRISPQYFVSIFTFRCIRFSALETFCTVSLWRTTGLIGIGLHCMDLKEFNAIGFFGMFFRSKHSNKCQKNHQHNP